jgi:putative addiction module killer protein
MASIQKTEEFDDWLSNLRDAKARAKILVRVQRLEAGNPGDVKEVGDGISEMRIDCGPGYRVYYKRVGQEILLILCGGDKDSQDKDIKLAKKIASALKERWDNGKGDKIRCGRLSQDARANRCVSDRGARHWRFCFHLHRA